MTEWRAQLRCMCKVLQVAVSAVGSRIILLQRGTKIALYAGLRTVVSCLKGDVYSLSACVTNIMYVK